MNEWLRTGGWVMGPLLLCSIIAVFVGLERILFFISWRNSQESKKLTKVREMLWSYQFQGARGFIGNSRDLKLQSLQEILNHPKSEHVEKPIQMTTQKGLKKWGRFLTTLETLLTTAPMLGILGTVSGIIKTFRALSWDQPDTQSLAMSGLSEALRTTEFGLFIAIPCGVLAAILHRQSEKWVDDMDHLGNEMEHILAKYESGKSQGA